MTDRVKNRYQCAALCECGSFVRSRSIAGLGLIILNLRSGSRWQSHKNQYRGHLPAQRQRLYLKPIGSNFFAEFTTAVVVLMKQQQAWRDRNGCVQTDPEQGNEKLIEVPARARVSA